jgi:serine/threonine protein kinase
MPLTAGTLEQVASAVELSQRVQVTGLVGRVLVRLLADLQAAGIRYTDFKLSNVLVLPWGALVLADFGHVACLLDSDGSSSPKELLDVPPIMASPKAAMGKMLAGCEFDTWFVGVLLLELLLGAKAYMTLRRANRTIISSMGFKCLMHVADLRDACSNSPVWQQPGVAAMGNVLFSCLVVEDEARSCADELLQLPCFSTAPTWGELALLSA